MTAIGRRYFVAAGAALIAACSSKSGPAAVSADDMAVGAPDAPVTLIEYASTTCPHCADFHEQVYAQIKMNYVDKGKLRFIFREFPTAPEQIAVAAFQVARCDSATPEQYMSRLSVLFEQQRAMFASGSIEGIKQKLIEIGQLSNLSEDQVLACIADEAGPARITRTVTDGRRMFDITGTPTLILNGRKLTDPNSFTYEGLAGAIDAELAK